LINGLINTDLKFSLQLAPDADGKPREPTQTLVKDVFSMMEVNGRKVWVCLARGSTESYTGYFSSIMESINVHVTIFVALPGAHVYWWLRHRGCLAEDVNRMIHHCFALDQQQKVTESKYIADKGFAVLDDTESDDIINAVAGADIYDTALGLSDKEQRTAATSKGCNASAIMFGEAKEEAVEAHNFPSKASVTTIHSKNMEDSRTVATERILVRSVFSMVTSKVTTDSLAEGMDDNNDLDNNSGAEKSEVAIEGMHMLSGHRRTTSGGESMQEDEVPGEDDEENKDKEEQVHNQEEAALTRNMNIAMAKLNLSFIRWRTRTR
jgi:hypothetical protein